MFETYDNGDDMGLILEKDSDFQWGNMVYEFSHEVTAIYSVTSF